MKFNYQLEHKMSLKINCFNIIISKKLKKYASYYQRNHAWLSHPVIDIQCLTQFSQLTKREKIGQIIRFNENSCRTLVAAVCLKSIIFGYILLTTEKIVLKS